MLDSLNPTLLKDRHVAHNYIALPANRKDFFKIFIYYNLKLTCYMHSLSHFNLIEDGILKIIAKKKNRSYISFMA